MSASALRVPLTTTIPQALRFINAGVTKMDMLLAGLLRYSRMGRVALTIAQLDMNELLADIVAAMKFQIDQAKAEIELAPLPPCLGDRAQTNQVFSNLLDNALKYRDAKRPLRIKVVADGKEIDFKAPYKRITMYDAINEYTGYDINGMDEAALRNVCAALGIYVDASMGPGKLIDEIFSEKCEKNFVQPTFIIDYPVEMSPLTKKHRSKEGLVERFELMINGKEMANAYTELNDPIDQRERFEQQAKLMERGDEEAMYIDYDFLRALEYGMPPTAGIGFGIDRLCMLMAGQPSIQDVLLFPQMRNEEIG